MKEILQTKYLNLKSTLLEHTLIFLLFSCIVHVEYVDQEPVAVEEEAAAEDQEEQQLQESEVVDQVEEQDPSDFTNPDQQPGKHRKHLNPVSFIFKVLVLPYVIYMCIKLIGVVVTPRMHVVDLIYPILDNSLIIIMIGSNALLSAIVSIEVECF